MTTATVTATTVRGFYVSIVDGKKRGLLYGPLVDHASAYALVETVREWVIDRSPVAHFYGFGTASVTGETWEDLPRGRLTEQINADAA